MIFKYLAIHWLIFLDLTNMYHYSVNLVSYSISFAFNSLKTYSTFPFLNLQFIFIFSNFISWLDFIFGHQSEKVRKIRRDGKCYWWTNYSVWVTALCCIIESTWESSVEYQESSFGFKPFYATGLSIFPENIRKPLVF